MDLETLLNEKLKYLQQFEYVGTTGGAQLGVFIDKVREYGDWDYKRPLGWDIYYNVSLEDDIFQMTGEQLGNYNYGYVGTGIGYSKEVLTMAGGIVNVMGSWDFKYCDSVNLCDVPDDVQYVKKGIKAYKNK